MARLRCNMLIEIVSGPQRAEVLNRIRTLSATGNPMYNQYFLLTDASSAAAQQQVIYHRDTVDGFQSPFTGGAIIVDPPWGDSDGDYADGSTVTDNIWAQFTISDTSNANLAAQNPFRIRREVPCVMSTGEFYSSTTLSTSVTADRVLNKVEVVNDNASGAGSVRVGIWLWK